MVLNQKKSISCFKALGISLLMAFSLTPVGHTMPGPVLGVADNLSKNMDNESSRQELEKELSKHELGNARGTLIPCLHFGSKGKVCLGDSLETSKNAVADVPNTTLDKLIINQDEQKNLTGLWAFLTMPDVTATFDKGNNQLVEIGLSKYFLANQITATLGEPPSKFLIDSTPDLKAKFDKWLGADSKGTQIWIYPSVYFFVYPYVEEGKIYDVVIALTFLEPSS